MSDTISVSGAKVGFADYGEPSGTAVLWCHGGPGSRIEPKGVAAQAREAKLRLIGIDRPGYGLSTPLPGRSIADWVPHGLAVADHLGIDRFVAVGVSTGGAYALALASRTPRVIGVVACCALTDMRWKEGREKMGAGTADIWAANDRAKAISIAERMFGSDGRNMMSSAAPQLPAADMAMLSDPAFAGGFVEGMKASFAQGVVGYADDRLADGPGWGSFDLNAIRCPVIVLHGEQDNIVPVEQGHHTAQIVPGANLKLDPALGHLSIIAKVIETVGELPGLTR